MQILHIRTRTLNSKPKFRKTKVIATIGPACDSLEGLKAMAKAGMNVARLNMSHSDEAEHRRILGLIREASRQTGLTIASMVDTRGREIRSGPLKEGSILLKRHQPFSIYCDNQAGDQAGVSTTHTTLYQTVGKGHRILIDDGQIELVVDGVKSRQIHTRVICGGILRSGKGVNLPDSPAAFEAVSDNSDYEINFAISNDVEYLAASFIRNAEDVSRLRKMIKDRSGTIPIIAKIETREGVNNIDEIIATANGIMVARGDLGVELDPGEGPIVQKRIIRATVSHGKPVITATQMLDSMERNPRPTRAEVSDVANAIFDGSSAVMLSGETAVGRRPVEAVAMMDDLAKAAESSLSNFGHLQRIETSEPHKSRKVTDAVGLAAIAISNQLNASAIIALTETGVTARQVSKYRPTCPILAITSSPKVVNRLAMNWGVLGILYLGGGSDEERLLFATERGKELGLVQSGDQAILIAGSSNQAGSTNLIRVITVP
ncbi:MAG: pyruvate kinase, partial [Gammaproteobacteria bacterium]|nr:pyruvate kinase [Gammaproteobacteria bacterium]